MTVTTPDLLPQDFLRSYDLPDTVESMIPTRSEPGEPGLHWVARGLMAETCAQLLARPISLDLLCKRQMSVVSVHVSLASSVLSTSVVGDLVSVDLLLVRDTGQWGLFYCDRMLAHGRYVPSPSYLAGLIAQEYDRGRRPIDTCRAPVEPPKHLW